MLARFALSALIVFALLLTADALSGCAVAESAPLTGEATTTASTQVDQIMILRVAPDEPLL